MTAVCYCDENGHKVDEPSRFLALDLYVSPEEGTPFACTGRTEIFIWSDPYELLFSYEGQVELSIDKKWTRRSTAADMGAKHIVLAGCSNGGYMCLMLSMKSPDKYDAVVPICEAVLDSTITEASIERLRKVPLYFVYSKDDPIVIPELHEIPTIRRLKAGKCLDLHVSETDKVVDTSGIYKGQDGSPYEYMGHLSWIYYDNDETDDGSGLSAWKWIADRISRG